MFPVTFKKKLAEKKGRPKKIGLPWHYKCNVLRCLAGFQRSQSAHQ